MPVMELLTGLLLSAKAHFNLNFTDEKVIHTKRTQIQDQSPKLIGRL